MKRIYKKDRVKNPRQYTPKTDTAEPERKRSWNWDNYDDPEVSKLLGSQRWKDLREYVLNRHPLCALCGKPAMELHHIEPVRKDMSLFFRVDNLAPLCEECHVKVTSAYRRGIEPEVLFPKDRRLNL